MAEEKQESTAAPQENLRRGIAKVVTLKMHVKVTDRDFAFLWILAPSGSGWNTSSCSDAWVSLDWTERQDDKVLRISI